MQVDGSVLNCFGDDQTLNLGGGRDSFDRRMSKQIIDQYLDESNFESPVSSSIKLGSESSSSGKVRNLHQKVARSSGIAKRNRSLGFLRFRSG